MATMSHLEIEMGKLIRIFMEEIKFYCKNLVNKFANEIKQKLKLNN